MEPIRSLYPVSPGGCPQCCGRMVCYRRHVCHNCKPCGSSGTSPPFFRILRAARVCARVAMFGNSGTLTRVAVPCRDSEEQSVCGCVGGACTLTTGRSRLHLNTSARAISIGPSRLRRLPVPHLCRFRYTRRLQCSGRSPRRYSLVFTAVFARHCERALERIGSRMSAVGPRVAACANHASRFSLVHHNTAYGRRTAQRRDPGGFSPCFPLPGEALCPPVLILANGREMCAQRSGTPLALSRERACCPVRLCCLRMLT